MAFESDGESVQIVGQEAVQHISELTGADPDSVSKSLLYRTVATGGGEVIEKGHTEQEACFGRDAFAKVLFLRKSPRGRNFPPTCSSVCLNWELDGPKNTFDKFHFYVPKIMRLSLL